MLIIGLVLLVIVAPVLLALYCRMGADLNRDAQLREELTLIPVVTEFDPEALLVDMAQRDRVRGDRLV